MLTLFRSRLVLLEIKYRTGKRVSANSAGGIFGAAFKDACIHIPNTRTERTRTTTRTDTLHLSRRAIQISDILAEGLRFT